MGPGARSLRFSYSGPPVMELGKGEESVKGGRREQSREHSPNRSAFCLQGISGHGKRGLIPKKERNLQVKKLKTIQKC